MKAYSRVLAVATLIMTGCGLEPIVPIERLTHVRVDTSGYDGLMDLGASTNLPPDLGLADCWYGQSFTSLSEACDEDIFWRMVGNEIEDMFYSTAHQVAIEISSETWLGKTLYVTGGLPATNIRGRVSVNGGGTGIVYSRVLCESGNRSYPGKYGDDPVGLWVTFFANVCAHEIAHMLGWQHNDSVNYYDSMAVETYRPIFSEWRFYYE